MDILIEAKLIIFNERTSSIEELIHVKFNESSSNSTHNINDDIVDTSPIHAGIPKAEVYSIYQNFCGS